MSRELDVATLPLHGLHLIEASAGTGKTYNIALLHLRLLLERGLDVRNVAVVTFTDAATRELRQRLRDRLAEARQRLEQAPRVPPDDLDAILAVHRDDGDAQARALLRLEAALGGFDEAMVSTLHGLCKQLLGELAFESGLPFIELDGESINDAALELVRDYWRRCVVAEPVAFVDDVLERWSDPDALASHLISSQALSVAATSIDPQEPRQRVEACSEGVADADAAWLRVCRSGRIGPALVELQAAIDAKLLSVDKQKSSHHKRAMDDLARALDEAAGGTIADATALTPLSREAILADRSKKALNQGWLPDGALGEVSHVADQVCKARIALRRARLALFLCDALDFVRDGLAARRERLRRFGFDDLIRGMHAQLHGPRGDAVARQLVQRLPALLVDEFQDTDPLQYAILRRIQSADAAAALFLIGDPKQAIYRFRGGDIFTYRHAVIDAGHNGHTLRDNWRSDRRLIEAANAVFGRVDTPFVYDFIGFEDARYPALRDKERHWLEDDAPMVVWRAPDCADRNGKIVPWTKPAFSDRVLAETGREIKALLREAERRGDTSLTIAVLVNTNRQAEDTARALARWNIACDYLSTASVHAGDEALELANVVAALCAPGNAAVVRAALATELLGETLASLLAAQSDLEAWEAQLARISALRKRWLEAGPYAAIAQCVQAAAPRLLPRWDGRRRVTNFLHLADLLQHEAASRGTPEELLHWLSARRAEALARRGDGHAEWLRPADDPGAVQVLTIHRSKGLQYDAVFAPFLLGTHWRSRQPDAEPDEAVAWHNDDELRIDIGGPDWGEHARLHRDEQFAESLRLAYVAITRAKHRVWLAWAFANTGRNHGTSRIGPLAWLWLRNEGMKEPEDLDALDPERVDDALAALAARSNGSIAIAPITADLPRADATPLALVDADLVAPQFRGRIDRRFETMSYSRLFGGNPHAPAADHDEAGRAAVVASVDEGDAVPQWPRGAAFGNCMHEVYEKIAFTDLANGAVSAQLARICQDHGHDGPIEQRTIAAMARATVATELLPGSGFTLAALAPGEALPELEFLFPLGGARLDGLERILARAPRHARAAGELGARRAEVAGLMTGFIDLVVRWDSRYYVLDYKTNLLGATRADYAVTRLPVAIRAHDYDLQYLIYLVALQRFLRARLGVEYDYDRHVGGALYLFVRGMREGDVAGIHHDRPARELIDAIDAWCAGGAP